MLSCENLKDCEDTLKSILGVDDKALKRIKSEVKNLYLKSSNWQLEPLLVKHKITLKENMSVCFFHFSKTLNPTEYKKGILPLPLVLDSILEDISSLYKSHTKTEIIRIINEKLRENTKKRIYNFNDGPDGFLIKEHGFLRDTVSELYIEGSEFVKDVIEALSYDETLYQSESKMIIVKFKVSALDSKGQRGCIKQALEYISLGNHPEYLKFMTYAHDNKGISINPDNIVFTEIY